MTYEKLLLTWQIHMLRDSKGYFFKMSIKFYVLILMWLFGVMEIDNLFFNHRMPSPVFLYDSRSLWSQHVPVWLVKLVGAGHTVCKHQGCMGSMLYMAWLPARTGIASSLSSGELTCETLKILPASGLRLWTDPHLRVTSLLRALEMTPGFW